MASIVATLDIGHNGVVTSTPISHRPAAGVINRPNTVQVGTIVWLGSEVMFFAGLFAVYFTLKSTSPGLWADQSSKLNIVFSAIITIILVASSFTAQFGVFAAERLQKWRTGPWWNLKRWGVVEWFFLSFFLGALFIIGQVYEYALLVTEGVGFTSDSFGSAFYLTTGFHGLHVTGGLIAFVYLLMRTKMSKFTPAQATSAIVVSYYWHFVDIVWIGLFTIIYFIP
jgi:cytochrome c oxidase subunit 3